jgi:hypothetical protein
MGNRPWKLPKTQAGFFAASFLLFLLPGTFLFAQKVAQKETEKFYFIDDSSGTIKFIQRLSWYPEDYASRYEICVEEKQPDGSWREILRESTEEDHLDLSLPAASYRYRIQSYDLLDKPVEDPPWISMEILPALQPELFALEPETLVPGGQSSFTLRGRNMAAGARVILRNRRGGREEEGEFLPSPGENSGYAVFSSRLAAGVYDLVLENPGGLSDALGPLTVLSSRTAWYFSAGYKPMFPLYGQLTEMLEAGLYPLGFYARFGAVPFQWRYFDAGLEADAGWNYLLSDFSSGGINYEVTGHFSSLKAHVFIQTKLADGHVALRLQGGGGLAAALNFQKYHSGLKTKAVNTLYSAASAGFSALWYFSEPWFAMAGLEYLHLFSADDTDPAFILPFAGIGLRF